ncbi:MAG: hypothetical protein K8T89_06810 [Planctomycetes bacterium]|nr:hypothetical protein [Planctomycetota bacterium]
MQITREMFDDQRTPRFGTANPERLCLPFWEWMVRGGENPFKEGREPDDAHYLTLREAYVHEWPYHPWRAREIFGIKTYDGNSPIWTFDRFGSSRTVLSDGRAICVGGEHEDFYQPDFYIYNDVVVLGDGGSVEVYGYPRATFPPTDFHTASLFGDYLFIVGCLGYKESRRPGLTPVYALNLITYEITEVPTSGESPGWLYEHEAEVQLGGTIAVTGGYFFEIHDGEQVRLRNLEDYSLDTRTRVWQRLTERNWPQFLIRCDARAAHQAGGKLEPVDLFCDGLLDAEFVGSCEGKSRQGVFRVPEGVMLVEVDMFSIEIDVMSHSAKAVDTVPEAIRAKAEKLLCHPCVLKRVR